MNRIKIVVLFFITLFLDLSVLSRFSIFGVTPFIALAIIVVLSMKAKTEKITYFSIILGLIMDVYFSNLLGLRALIYYLISYYTFKNKRFEGNSFTYGMTAIVIGSLINYMYMFVIKTFSSLSQVSSKLLTIFARNLVIEVIIGAIMYTITYLFIEKILFREKKSFFV